MRIISSVVYNDIYFAWKMFEDGAKYSHNFTRKINCAVLLNVLHLKANDNERKYLFYFLMIIHACDRHA